MFCRILIFTHPGSRISDPKTATKERGGKKFVVIPFFVATKLSKIRVWDPGSGKKPIPDPGVKKSPDPGSATLASSKTNLC
jgi:hypothetical protein